MRIIELPQATVTARYKVASLYTRSDFNEYFLDLSLRARATNEGRSPCPDSWICLFEYAEACCVAYTGGIHGYVFSSMPKRVCVAYTGDIHGYVFSSMPKRVHVAYTGDI
jgi:hypothetical protein